MTNVNEGKDKRVTVIARSLLIIGIMLAPVVIILAARFLTIEWNY